MRPVHATLSLTIVVLAFVEGGVISLVCALHGNPVCVQHTPAVFDAYPLTYTTEGCKLPPNAFDDVEGRGGGGGGHFLSADKRVIQCTCRSYWARRSMAADIFTQPSRNDS
mgnify:CR=1 FL=1